MESNPYDTALRNCMSNCTYKVTMKNKSIIVGIPLTGTIVDGTNPIIIIKTENKIFEVRNDDIESMELQK